MMTAVAVAGVSAAVSLGEAIGLLATTTAVAVRGGMVLATTTAVAVRGGMVLFGGTAEMGGKGELCRSRPQLRPWSRPQLRPRRALRPRSRPQLRCLGLLHLSLSRPQLRFQAVAVAMTWLRLARHQRGQPSSNALWRLVLR